MLSKTQEEGLLKYRNIERQLSEIEDKIIRNNELQQSSSGLVSKYNRKVDELSKIVEDYHL